MKFYQDAQGVTWIIRKLQYPEFPTQQAGNTLSAQPFTHEGRDISLIDTALSVKMLFTREDIDAMTPLALIARSDIHKLMNMLLPFPTLFPQQAEMIDLLKAIRDQ